MTAQEHIDQLNLALSQARLCPGGSWYCVGAVIIDAAGSTIATGHTGERIDGDAGQRHAEEVAIEKVLESGSRERLRAGTTIYSTMEPCSKRASGKKSCTSRIIEAGIGRVVYGAKEPYNPALGITCEGHKELQAGGLEVIQVTELEASCLEAALAKRPIRSPE